MTTEEQQRISKFKNIMGAILLFIFLWILLGFIAFVWSIVCFAKSGTTVDHVIGLLLAIFFGPLYFIYYGVRKDYCRKKYY